MSEIHGAVGAYVLNALDGHDLHEFEAHLADCATCQREVVEFRQTATELSLLSRTTPPPTLKESVMTAIAGVRVLPPEGAVEADQASMATEAVPHRALNEVLPEPTDELAARRQRRMTRLLSLAVAVVTVVALALGGWVVSLSQRQPPVAVASVTAETELLRAPDLMYSLVASDPAFNIEHTETRLVTRDIHPATVAPLGQPICPLMPRSVRSFWPIAPDCPCGTPGARLAGALGNPRPLEP